MDFDGSKQNTSADLLSALPVEVLHETMERLTLRDAARMSVLSSEWRNIWLSLPCIQIENRLDCASLGGKISESGFNSNVDRILLHHEGPIVMFTISYHPKLSSPRLFSCSELRILTLRGCTINIPPSFTGFRNLLSLKLIAVLVEASSGDASSCGSRLIHMCSSQLEELVLDDCSRGFEDITIDSPVLRRLEITGFFKSVCLKNAPNLRAARLDLDEVEDWKNYEKARDLINFLAVSCRRIEELYLGQVFQCVFLERYTLELATFDHLTRLGIGNIDLNNPCFVKSMMRSCPKMSDLSLDSLDMVVSCDHDLFVNTSHEVRASGEVFESGHNCRLDHLRRIKIYDFTGARTEFKFIEFLLRNSPKLVKLHIIRHVAGCHLEWELGKELQRFPRASSKAEILVDNSLPPPHTYPHCSYLQ